MSLTEQQQDFLTRRAKLTKSWKYAGLFLILLVFGLMLTLYLRTPLLIDPLAAAEEAREHNLEQGTRDLMLAMLPIVMNAVCFLLLLLIGMMYLSFTIERRYQTIIDRMRNDGDN